MVSGVVVGGITEVTSALDTALAIIGFQGSVLQQVLGSGSILELVEVVSAEGVCIGVLLAECSLLVDADGHVHDEADGHRSVVEGDEPDPSTLVYK